MADHPDIRIGDRERLAAQDRLREAYGRGVLDLEEFEDRLAVAMVARTNGELQPLLADLPSNQTNEVSLEKVDAAPVVPPPPPTSDDDDEGGGWWGWALVWLAVLGAIGVGGLGLRGTGIDAVTMFGSRHITVGPDDPDVGMLTLFGSVQVEVQDGAQVRNSMTSMFGSSECSTTCVTTLSDEDPTTVTVGGLTMFGSVEFVGEGQLGRD